MTDDLAVLVLTAVHHPEDARIRHRQIPALLDAGWRVGYAAAWTASDAEPPADVPGLTAIDLPRACGRKRLAAQRAARKLLGTQARGYDVVLLHDPELLVAAMGLDLPPVVWDVHEDAAAAVEVKGWIPAPLRSAATTLTRWAERRAEQRHTLLLADAGYQHRFTKPHAVVPNVTDVPARPEPAGRPDDQGRHRVVYLGSMTMERGAAEVVEVGHRLRTATAGQVVLHVLGPAHGQAAELLSKANARGDVQWHGFVPNSVALEHLDGALAGLSLLHDAANFRPSMPTKVVEYLAHGVPAVVTPLPLAAELIENSAGGQVVPFDDVVEATKVLLAWHQQPAQAVELGRRGHAYVAQHFDWKAHAPGFVAELERVALGR